jgi:hypothetical protein
MKKLISLFFLVSVTACTRDSVQLLNPQSISGVWIESSLRLDTLDFDSFPKDSNAQHEHVLLRSKPFTDASLNPTYPVNPSAIYNYYFKADSVYLYNLYSSLYKFNPYKIQVSSDVRFFDIEKFYTRTGLNKTVLRFERFK